MASFFASLASRLFQPWTARGDIMEITSLPPPAAAAGADVTLGRVFGLLDQNGDGVLSVKEICQGFHKLGVDMSHEQLDALIASYPPLSQTGLLQLHEFEALYASVCREFAFMDDDDEGHQQQASAAPSSSSSSSYDDDDDDGGGGDGLLEEAFRVFDKNADGFISLAELQEVLCSLGFSECQDASFCRGIMQRVDSNADGLVDFSEFKHMMLSSH